MRIAEFITGLIIGTTLIGCGGGGDSAPVQPSSNNAPTPSPPVSKVTISGQITYDHVPHSSRNLGLNYGAIERVPVRGIMVLLLDENNETVEQSLTDGQGNYSFSVNASQDVKVQARAQLRRAGQWDVKITDNTQDNDIYVLEGSLNSSGTNSVQTRNLHAPSGWGGSGYSGPRAAGPFAILSPVYDSIQAMRDVDATAGFPDLEFRWSPDNQPVLGNRSLGQIGTSGFVRSENAVYLLGAENRDTDEYDPHVIIHEWAHYFEHNLSRLDSLGGLHSLNDKLDARVAFSEGWGNGLSAIITGDPEYKDSSGEGQGSGFKIDFENLNSTRAGWFNEGSIAAIFYDIFDDAADGADRMNVGLAPIYGAMTSPQLMDGDVFATMFSFSDSLLDQPGINESDYGLLLESQNIFSSDAQGAGEQNNGTIASSLPVYKEAVIDGPPTQICSVDDAGRFNKLGNREFVFFNIPSDGHYEIQMSVTSNETLRDPDFVIWQSGEVIQVSESSQPGEEGFSGTFSAGNYVAEGYDFYNINGNSNRRGDACFEFTIRVL